MKKIKVYYRLLKIRRISAKKRRLKVLDFDPFEITDFDHLPFVPFNKDEVVAWDRPVSDQDIEFDKKLEN